MIRRPLSIVFALVAIVCALGLSACGGVDAGKLQDQIKEDIEQEGGKVTEVSCPDDEDLKKGNKFNCTAKTAGGDEVSIPVEITSEDDGGRAEYQIPPQVLVGS